MQIINTGKIKRLENREHRDSEIADVHLDDETIES